MKKHIRTVVSVEIFSNKSIKGLSLDEIVAHICNDSFTQGNMSTDEKEISPMAMSEALLDQGNEPIHVMEQEAERGQPHMCFEYDPAYSGGEHVEVGENTYIPRGILQKFLTREGAFEYWTGLDPMYIIHIYDHPCTASGETWLETGFTQWNLKTFQNETPMALSKALLEEKNDRINLMGQEAERDQPHICFEYDPLYVGGEHSENSELVYIPQGVFLRLDTYEKTFEYWTGLDKSKLMYVDHDNCYTADGDEW